MLVFHYYTVLCSTVVKYILYISRQKLSRWHSLMFPVWVIFSHKKSKNPCLSFFFVSPQNRRMENNVIFPFLPFSLSFLPKTPLCGIFMGDLWERGRYFFGGGRNLFLEILLTPIFCPYMTCFYGQKMSEITLHYGVVMKMDISDMRISVGVLMHGRIFCFFILNCFWCRIFHILFLMDLIAFFILSAYIIKACVLFPKFIPKLVHHKYRICQTTFLCARALAQTKCQHFYLFLFSFSKMQYVCSTKH